MKRKLTKKTKRAIFLYIVILLLLFTIVEVLPRVTNIFETTQVLEPGTLTLSYDTTGYFIKTEEIGVATDSGEIEYPITEGTVVKKGAEVQVVITPSGKEFITPLTLSTLSCHPVISEFFSNRDGSWNSHVDLGLWADAMLIAPATAFSIGKMANGIADNMLITTYLSCKAPVFIAPAMDLDMFAHPSTQANLD